MELSDVLEALLKAEDEASEMRAFGEQEAKSLLQKAREKFADDQQGRLAAAREEARSQVESARQSAEMEALHIAELARKSRDRMQEHFEANTPALVAKLAESVASKYASQGHSS